MSRVWSCRVVRVEVASARQLERTYESSNSSQICLEFDHCQLARIAGCSICATSALLLLFSSAQATIGSLQGTRKQCQNTTNGMSTVTLSPNSDRQPDNGIADSEDDLSNPSQLLSGGSLSVTRSHLRPALHFHTSSRAKITRNPHHREMLKVDIATSKSPRPAPPHLCASSVVLTAHQLPMVHGSSWCWQE